MTATLVAPVEITGGLWRGVNRALAVSGAGVFAAGLTTTLTVPSWAVPTSLAAAAVLAVAGGVTLFESLRAGKGFAGIGSCVLAVVLYLAVHESAVQLISGARRSVLDYIGFSQVSVREDTFRAVALFVMAAGAFAVGEGWAAGRPLPDAPAPRSRVPSYRPVFLALLAVGMATMLLTGHRVDAQVLDLRGQVTGQGAIGVLQQTLPLALAIGILHHHWQSRLLAGLSLLGLATYVTFVQSRSLLLFVGLAVVVRLIHSFRIHRVRPWDAVGLLALLYGAALFVVAFGQWRSAVRKYASSEFLPWLVQAFPNPFGQLSSKGSLDTLDGLVLSLHVDRNLVGASVLDPLKGLVNLVPTQLWTGKPEFLGPRVTHYYTDFGGRSGIFLSGPGYLYIVYAGLVGMTLASVALGVGTALLLRRSRQSLVLTVVVVYGLCRFLIGGDAFDLQYCLTLLLSLGVGVGAVRGIGWMHRPPIVDERRPTCV